MPILKACYKIEARGENIMSWIDSIKAYIPCNEQEARDRDIILYCIDKFEDVLTRNNEVAHITSSGFVMNKARDRILMVYHNIYNSWSWTGGHADGEEDLLGVAIREVTEETGVKGVTPVCTDIFSLDVLTVEGHIKKGRYVAPHLHLSVTYLLQADEGEDLVVKEDENSGVKWIPAKEVNRYSSEPYMIKVYEKLISKAKEENKNL